MRMTIYPALSGIGTRKVRAQVPG